MKAIFLLFLLLPSALSAAPTLLERGRDAETAENYQQALELYRQAMDEAPTDPAPATALAELFSQKGLHDLALPVWQEVLRRAPGEISAWLSLSQTWSYLDNNAQSVKTLGEARERFPFNAEVTQALAWMLFKTEDFQRGLVLVEGYIAEHGSDRSLEMTLGTLYSSVLDYGLSRVHYLKSIEMAPGASSESRNFRSIAWYNLSLLEKTFYQFERADEAIRKSIEEEDRPAGSLAWGELFQGSRNFAEARRLFEKAVQEDETPLARFDLAHLLEQAGLVDEAEAQLSLVEHHEDDTWIYNYGVTKDKILRDLHELRSDLHRARFHLLDFSPRASLWDWMVWAWKKAEEGLLWWYNDQTWKSLLVKLSDSSMAARNSPDAWVSLTLAHRDQPNLALKYLTLVRNHELAKNPRSAASYLVEEGIIRRDPRLLEWALTRTQVPWENEDRERALGALASVRLQEGRQAEFRRLLGQIYALNPGGLPTRGWGLPIRLSLYGDPAATEAWRQAWDAYAGQTGWDARTGDRAGVEWALDWRAEAAGAAWTLRDTDGNSVRSGTVATGAGLLPLAEVFRRIHAPQ